MGPPLKGRTVESRTLMTKNLIFTTHALRRMLKHGIRSGQVREALERGERIEEYPEDMPFPATWSWEFPAASCTSWPPTTPIKTRRS